MIKTKLHLLRYAYLSYRKLKPVKKICVMSGGKMSDAEFKKYNTLVNEIKNKV